MLLAARSMVSRFRGNDRAVKMASSWKESHLDINPIDLGLITDLSGVTPIILLQ